MKLIVLQSQHKERKKNRAIKKSRLDNVEGVGPILKSRLLRKYKNIQTIMSFTPEDLSSVKGININLAKLILKEIQ